MLCTMLHGRDLEIIQGRDKIGKNEEFGMKRDIHTEDVKSLCTVKILR